MFRWHIRIATDELCVNLQSLRDKSYRVGRAPSTIRLRRPTGDDIVHSHVPSTLRAYTLLCLVR